LHRAVVVILWTGRSFGQIGAGTEDAAAIREYRDAHGVVVVHDVEGRHEFIEQLTTECVSTLFVDQRDGHHAIVNLRFDQMHYVLLA
jgi:hypothetical protein